MTPAALDGVIVADFSRVLAGPYATMLLADLGATVIKVERPGVGDETREWGPPYGADGLTTYFASINRGKRSIALDLRDDADRTVALRLAHRADVLIENYKPGDLARYGLDYASLCGDRPDLVYCSITGFGSGAGRDLPGYDLLVQAMGGLMSVTGSHEPTKAGVAVVDVLTGLHAAVGILAALHHRDQTGEGQQVEVTLLTALLSSLVNQSGGYAGAGSVPTFIGNAHPSIAPYEVFAAADRPLVIAAGNDGQFARLVAALGAPDLANDERYESNSARVVNRLALKVDLERLLASATADEWQDRITTSGVPCGPINDIAQGFALAERLGLDSVVEIDDSRRPQPSRQVANPVRYSRTPARYEGAPPNVDEDRDAVLRLLDEDQA